MRPESRKLLADIQEAGSAVVRFVHEKTLADLKTDDLLRSAIYFKFAVIGEAVAQLRQQEPEVAQQISEHGRIVAFRNQIIHGYTAIDDEITWRIVEQKLPVLLRELDQLLRE